MRDSGGAFLNFGRVLTLWVVGFRADEGSEVDWTGCAGFAVREDRENDGGERYVMVRFMERPC